MQMGWRWDFTFEILPQMAIATLNTILAAGVGYAIALIVGLFFLLGQKTPFKIVNWINKFKKKSRCNSIYVNMMTIKSISHLLTTLYEEIFKE